MHSCFFFFFLSPFSLSFCCSSCVWRTSGHSSRCAMTSSACATVSCSTLLTSLTSGTSARWVKLYTCGWVIYFSASKKKALHLNRHCDQLKEWCYPEAIILTTAGAMRHDAACITDNIIYSRSSVLLLSDGILQYGGWNSYDQMSWYTAVYDSYQWNVWLLNQISLNST